MAQYQLRVNGSVKPVEAWDPDLPLLYALRVELGWHAANWSSSIRHVCRSCIKSRQLKEMR